MQRPEILNKLKAATKHQHDYLESISHTKKIADNSLTMEEYRHILLSNYYFHETFEKAVDSILTDSQKAELNWEARKKTHLLRADLETIGTDPFLLREGVFPALPMNTLEEVLGAMYVTEGSTLGGAVIVRHLRQNPNLASAREFKFYGCYGEQIGAMWGQYAMYVASHATTPQAEEIIVKAGVDTFEHFGKCNLQAQQTLLAA